MVNWEDGVLVTPAKANEDGTITPAVYNGNTPLTAYNLNKMQEDLQKDTDTKIDNLDSIIVSPTEPTGNNRKKVWIQKGKNWFDKDNAQKLIGNIDGAGNFNIANTNARTIYIECMANTVYTVSKKVGAIFRIGSFDKEIVNTVSAIESKVIDTGDVLTLNTGDNAKYLAVSYYNGNADTLTEQEMLNNIQIEIGTEATEYEEYINPTIYVKNNNDVYEKFVKNEKYNSREWITLNSTYSVKYRKIKDDVEISLNSYNSSNFSIGSAKTISMGTLPEQYRPSIPVYIPVYTNKASLIRFEIKTDGTVSLFNWGSDISVEAISAFVKYTV